MKFIKAVVFIAIIAVISVIGMYVKDGYTMYKEAITATSINEKVAEIEEKKHYTYFNDLPKTYVNAVIAAEDRRFYKHNGMDVISIGRAVIRNIVDRKLVEGGSTITQQLAKNIYFTQEKKLVRKIAESFMAVQLENELSKEKILELYVNTSYFGAGYYCVADASEGYFNKKTIEMDTYECTLLAGIPNAPSVYAPTKNFDLATQRQQQVLNKMIECGYITDEEAKEVIASASAERFDN